MTSSSNEQINPHPKTTSCISRHWTASPNDSTSTESTRNQDGDQRTEWHGFRRCIFVASTFLGQYSLDARKAIKILAAWKERGQIFRWCSVVVNTSSNGSSRRRKASEFGPFGQDYGGMVACSYQHCLKCGVLF